MSQVRNTLTVVCDGCGVEITWAPVLINHSQYCCLDCAAGRPCDCDYPPEEEHAEPQGVAVPETI